MGWEFKKLLKMKSITKEEIEERATKFASKNNSAYMSKQQLIYKAYCQGFAQALDFLNGDTEKRTKKLVCTIPEDEFRPCLKHFRPCSTCDHYKEYTDLRIERY